jgi:phosphatidylglycerophosphate synthase
VAKAGAEGSLVLVRATADEARGAERLVAGLTVVERALKQLLRRGHKVVVAGDGSVALPSLPLAVRHVSGPAAADVLARELGAPPVMPADTVCPAGAVTWDASGAPVGGIRVSDEPSRRRAEDAIFAALLRGDLGLVARHLNKPLSFRITRHLLCRLPVTPNQVTVGAGVVGLLGCALIAAGRPLSIFAGLLLAHLQSVLDGCDGELARVRFQQSAIGEWLDTLVDDGLNLALVAALGIGVSRFRGAAWPMVLALLTCAMLLTYNAVTYTELLRQGEGGEILKVRWWFNRGRDMKGMYDRAGASSLLMALGRRDFFLLAWVLLAALRLYAVIQLYALVVAVPSFLGALGQLALRPRPR